MTASDGSAFTLLRFSARPDSASAIERRRCAAFAGSRARKASPSTNWNSSRGMTRPVRLVGDHDPRFRIGQDLFDESQQVPFGIFQCDRLHGRLRVSPPAAPPLVQLLSTVTVDRKPGALIMRSLGRITLFPFYRKDTSRARVFVGASSPRLRFSPSITPSAVAAIHGASRYAAVAGESRCASATACWSRCQQERAGKRR